MREITKIEGKSTQPVKRKRVAAYARVSSGKDAQLHSLSAQISYYNNYIGSRGDWELAGIYADEAVTGTKENRPQFQRLLSDCRAGEIDMVIAKSITRLARNTVTLLETARELKSLEIDIYFEKEHIYTLDAKGEVMITIMSSLAQEESRSISENITWGKRRSMEEGKFSLAYKHFLGYKKGEDGILEIVEDEAKIVRKIYQLFLEEQTVRMIADHLTKQGIPTPMGKEKWSVSTIMSILQNEKYKGDALLQKTYVADLLTKRVKKNCGEIPQYYIKDSHPAIIDPPTFDLVQKEIERRRPERHKLHRSSPFTAKVICGDCGGYYGRKVWHSNSKHRKYIWRCNQKYEEKTACSTPNLDEATLKTAFVEAFNRMLGNKEQYIARFEEMLPLLADTSKLERQLTETQNKHSHLMNNLRLYMEENTRQIQDQEEYNRNFSEMDTECKKAEEEIEAIQKEILAQSGRKEQIRRCLDELRECGDILDEFDDDLWNSMIESVTIFADEKLEFLFRDGTKIPIQMPKNKKG